MRSLHNSLVLLLVSRNRISNQQPLGMDWQGKTNHELSFSRSCVLVSCFTAAGASFMFQSAVVE